MWRLGRGKFLAESMPPQTQIWVHVSIWKVRGFHPGLWHESQRQKECNHLREEKHLFNEYFLLKSVSWLSLLSWSGLFRVVCKDREGHCPILLEVRPTPLIHSTWEPEVRSWIIRVFLECDGGFWFCWCTSTEHWTKGCMNARQVFHHWAPALLPRIQDLWSLNKDRLANCKLSAVDLKKKESYTWFH